MPFYTGINSMKPEGSGQRTAERILRLRQLFDEGDGVPSEPGYVAPIPQRSLEDNIIIGSWNIREFDSLSFGKRSDEAMLYIAEIISRFDLVAIQEVGRDLAVLDRLRKVLGYQWNYIVTDETMGDKGNEERFAFFFDTKKVRFTGLAGEVVIPDSKFQYARTPFLVGFQAGWFKFTICTVHMYYGESKAVDPIRLKEIKLLAAHIKERMLTYRKGVEEKKLKHSEYENIFLMGDFNIFSVKDETFEALTDQGFEVSEGLFGAKTNTGKDHRTFDQIAFMSDAKNIQATGKSGVFDFLKAVYCDEDQDIYADQMQDYIVSANEKRTKSKKVAEYNDRSKGKQTLYYKTYWRTHQMSDHYPLWIELKTNFSNEYLERRAFLTK